MQNSQTHHHQKENKLKFQKKQKHNADLALKTITWPALAALTLSACGGGASNRPPTAAASSTVTLDEDSAANPLGVSAPTDEDINDTLTITVNEVPSGGTITTSTGTVVSQGSTLTVNQLTGLVFTPNADANSDLSEIGVFRYTVDDGKGGTASSTVTITVTPVADVPTITSSDNVSVEENDTAVMTVVGDDVDGDTLTYSVTGGADQDLFTIDSATGALSFKNKPDYENPSDSDGDNIYTVEVTADDGTGNTVSQTIQVTVTDVVTMVSIDNASINENDDGAVVGTISSVIDDTAATDIFTYTLSGTDADSFEVVNGQVKLKDSVSANYESQNSYSVTVTATDTGGLTASQEFTVTVNNLNDAPTLTNAIVDQSVDEDSAFSFTVPANTFNDEDGDTLTYTATLSDDSALPSWLSFDAATQTFSGTPLNGDVGSITVQVTATDAAGVAISDSFAIAVANTNDAPTLTNAIVDQSVDEDSTFSFTVPADTFNDVDVGDTLTYTATLSDSSALPSWLSFDAATQTFSGTPLNGDVGSITVQVTATDAAGVAISDSFAIAVANTNDAPTAIALSSLGVPEKIDGAVVGTLTTTDVDVGDTHTYTISDDRFEVVDGQLKLKAGNTAEYATEPTITLTVTTTDAAGATFDQEFTLTVGSIQISATTFAENAAGVVIGDLSMTDPDFTANVTYALSGTDAASFEVVNNQLKLKDTVSADFETKSTYSITITATDDASHEATLTYSLQVTDVNETPTVIALSATAIDENAAGATVGTLTTTDVDAGDTHTYTLSGTDADSFEVVDGQLKLKSSVTANYENKNSYSVAVTATDSGGLTTSQSFTVTVNNLNDAPTLANAIVDQSVNEDSAFSFVVPTDTFNDEDGDTLTYTATLSDSSDLPAWLSFDIATQTFSGTPLNADVGAINVIVTATDAAGVAVNDTFTITVANTNDAPTAIALSATAIDENAAGATVGSLSTTDVDVGDTHTYTLSGTDASLFEVVNGQLKLKGSADYETKNSYSVTVTATDAAEAVFAQSFTVTVTDVNEGPTAIALSATAIDENAAGATVGTLSTTDVDAGDSHTYTLSGTDASLFEVVNGELKLIGSADYETQTSYSVTVTATDSGGLTTPQDFTVDVNNLNDNDPVITSDSAISMEENSNSVGTVTATDADGDSLTYSITGGDDSGLFTIDATTGALTLQAKTDGLTTTDSTLPVTLTNMVDNGDGTYTADIEVDPTFAEFAALAGITIWLSFDSSEMSFTDEHVVITNTDGFSESVTTIGDGRIKLLWLDTTNTFEAGKLGTITFTPTSGATDPAITIEAQLIGGDLNSIDATKSTTDSTIYNFTIVRTNVDFENPVDSDTDNVYKVTIQVSDGENTASQEIEVTVTDVAESSKPSATNTDDSADPITDDDNDTPPDIDLPDWSLFVAGLDLDSITLPETVVASEDNSPTDLSDLIGLIGDQGESLALDFDSIDADAPVIASVESVKPVIVDWIAHTEPFIDSDWTPIIEELFYTSDLG